MGKLALTDVISLRTLQKIQDNFSEATGISISIRDLDNQLLTRISNKTNLWSFIEQNDTFKASWNEQNFKAWEEAMKTGEVVVYERRAETYAFTVPITLNGKVSAFFIGGLVRLGNPNMVVCKEEAVLLGMNLDDFLDLFLQLPLFTKHKLEAAGNLLRIIANTISNLEIEGNKAKAQVQEISHRKDFLEKEVRHQAHDLKQTEMKYSRLFEMIHDGVYMADMEGRYKDINPAGAKMLGYEPEELIGKMIKNSYVNPDQRKPFLDKILKNGYIENFNALLKLRNGEIRMFETTAVLLKDREGKNVGIQGIFRDITHRKHHNLVHVSQSKTFESSQHH